MASASERPLAHRVAEAADTILRVVRRRPRTLGGSRLVCIDGPAGAGKTTLAEAIAARSGADVIHMDDLYEGWGGLVRGTEQLRPVLAELAAGRPGRFHRFDWAADDYGDAVTVAPTDLLVVEGVGSGVRAYDAWRTVLVWVAAPPDLRKQRALARGGIGVAEHWEQWARDEDALFTAERTLTRADFVIDASE